MGSEPIAQAGGDAQESFQSSLADQIKPPPSSSGSGSEDASTESGGAEATDTATPVETATP